MRNNPKAWVKWPATWAIIALAGGCSVSVKTHAASGSPAPPATRPPATTRPRATTPTAATAPPPATASPPVADIRPGSQNCTFNASDGGEIASVTVTGTVCRDWPADLAHDGQYWWQVSYQAPGTEAAEGGVQACALSLHGVTMNVYDQTSNSPQQTPAGIAKGVCQGAEQYGWAPS